MSCTGGLGEFSVCTGNPIGPLDLIGSFAVACASNLIGFSAHPGFCDPDLNESSTVARTDNLIEFSSPDLNLIVFSAHPGFCDPDLSEFPAVARAGNLIEFSTAAPSPTRSELKRVSLPRPALNVGSARPHRRRFFPKEPCSQIDQTESPSWRRTAHARRPSHRLPAQGSWG